MRGNNMAGMLFGAFFLIVLYIAAHWFVYFSVVHFFRITNETSKIVLTAVLIFLAGSFFLSSFVAHFLNDSITREYYFLSGIWTGVVTNFVLVFAIAWIIEFFTRQISNPFGQIIIGSFAIIFTFVYSVHGIYNAMHPVVKEVTVKIKNLPAKWKGKKIVQLSDIHLGFVYREDSLANIKKTVDEIKPDLIAITGDLFDGSDGDLGWASQYLDALSAPQGVYYITGNHETYLGLDKARGVLKKTSIVQLRDSLVEKDGLQIIGVDYPMQMDKKDIVQTIEKMNFDSNKPSVLLYHAPVQIAQLKQLGISLMLSGHTHVGQLFPFRSITDLIYKGYDYGLKQEGDFSIYTTNGIGTWGPAMRTGNKPEIVSITLQ